MVFDARVLVPFVQRCAQNGILPGELQLFIITLSDDTSFIRSISGWHFSFRWENGMNLFHFMIFFVRFSPFFVIIGNFWFIFVVTSWFLWMNKFILAGFTHCYVEKWTFWQFWSNFYWRFFYKFQNLSDACE